MNAWNLTVLTPCLTAHVTRKAICDAGLSGLSGLTGCPAHASVCVLIDYSVFCFLRFFSRERFYYVNPVNPVKRNKHAGFNVTEPVSEAVRPR